MAVFEFAPWLCWLLPLLGALLILIFSKIYKVRDFIAVFFPFLSAVMAILLLPSLITGEYVHPVELKFPIYWLEVPSWFGGSDARYVYVRMLLDPLSIIMVNIVTIVGFLIVVYSLGYMKEDPYLTRYWFLMNIFIGCMSLVVLAGNLVMLIIGWEGVGLCSYSLIGYYQYDKRERWIGGPEPKAPLFTPSHCGMKAFLMTYVGDSCMIAAVLIIYAFAGTFSFTELYATAPIWIGKMNEIPGLLALTALLLLGGPIGKSAQFPLCEWLPEAMAGPAPVSALIHAATMVKAGVYFVARMSPIFFAAWMFGYSEAGAFFIALTLIGTFTAFLAATQAITALELKKALAYSTISQIGYMMLALGVAGLSRTAYLAGFVAAVFHLMSHAIFKSTLFLCSGNVTHACKSIYMTDMGGLRKDMPLTHLTMLITASTLAGVPPLVGFWSKDAVMVASLEAGQVTPFVVAAATAAMTVFYSVRFIAMTFYGKKSEHVEELERKGVHVHEARSVMWVPSVILALLAIGLGVVAPSLEGFLNKMFKTTFIEAYHLPLTARSLSSAVSTPIFVATISISMLLLGGVPSYLIYIKRKIDPKKFLEEHKRIGTLHSFVWNRWYIDSVYYKGLYAGTRKTCSLVDRLWEVSVIYRISPAVAKAATKAYHSIKRAQTGVLSYNMVYVVITLLALMCLFVFVIL
ncbi:MAG: NADH-quinone oxidoreductase subunit L [Candidatus Bathyarchaeia archaeon]